MDGKPGSSFHSSKSKANQMNLVMTGHQVVESNKRGPGSAGEQIETQKHTVHVPAFNNIPQSSTKHIQSINQSNQILQSSIENGDPFMQNNQSLEQAANAYYSHVNQDGSERVSGFPMPELYNQHYINKYSFPKGLIAQRKPEDQQKRMNRQSIYDMYAQPARKGVSGWKLTKRMNSPPASETKK